MEWKRNDDYTELCWQIVWIRFWMLALETWERDMWKMFKCDNAVCKARLWSSRRVRRWKTRSSEEEGKIWMWKKPIDVHLFAWNHGMKILETFFLYRERTKNGELSSHLNFIETFHSVLQRHSSPCEKEEAYKIFEWANFTRVEWDGKEMLSTRAFHSFPLSPTTQTHIHLRLFCCCSTLERK